MAKKKKIQDTRRERGLGTIIQKEGGVWEVQVTIGYDPITKKRIRETFSSKDETEVKAKRLELLQKRSRFRGEYKNQNLTLGDWLDEWLNENKKIKIAETTYAKYETLIRVHIKPRLGHIPLTDVTQTDVQKFVNTILEEGTPRVKMVPNDKHLLEKVTIPGTPLSAATTIECHSILYAAYKKAIAKQIIEFNPCFDTELPKLKHRKRGIFEKDDIPLLIAEAKKADAEADDKYAKFKIEEKCCWYISIKLLFETGFRRGELLGLKWSDISNGYINLQQAYIAINGKGTESDLKTSSSYRGIPIQPDTLEDLRNWKEKQRQIKIRNKKIYKDNDYIFTDHTGKPIAPNWFSKKMKKLQARLGLKELSPHCVRHTTTTALIQEGVPISDVVLWGGWKNARVPLDVYAHAYPSNKQVSSRILSNLTKEKEPSSTESSNS